MVATEWRGRDIGFRLFNAVTAHYEVGPLTVCMFTIVHRESTLGARVVSITLTWGRSSSGSTSSVNVSYPECLLPWMPTALDAGHPECLLP